MGRQDGDSDDSSPNGQMRSNYRQRKDDDCNGSLQGVILASRLKFTRPEVSGLLRQGDSNRYGSSSQMPMRHSTMDDQWIGRFWVVVLEKLATKARDFKTEALAPLIEEVQ
jgi:hypothetical protein